MKTVTILGSTGSVGTQVLKVIDRHPDTYKVVGLSAYKNADLLRKQLDKYAPDFYYYPDGAVEVQSSIFDLFEDKNYTKCLSSLEELASQPSDIVVLAVSGIAGLWAACAALKRGATLAIANKETIVAAGRHLKALEKKYGGKILPLDTEHSAIFECLRGEDKAYIKKLILTASGGAFRDMPLDKLSKVTPEQALEHPVWSMGKKITVDSATLFNKGLEVIEAMRLFDVGADNVDVLMHRESLIHSLVELSDGSQKALISVPDMALAIESALCYPAHGVDSVSPLSLADIGELHFGRPDLERYPCLELAIEAAKAGEEACIALSAADEVLVEEFLKGKIKFTDIANALRKVLVKFSSQKLVELDEVLCIDERSRKYTYSIIGAK